MYNNPPPKGTPKNGQPDLRTKFNLPPQPASVQKISGLVRGREESSMDEIANIIETDNGVKQRLMSLAYPKAAARTGATTQMATARLGVNKVIVVIVGDLLVKAVMETFATMVELPLEVADPLTVSMPEYRFLTGSIRFTGQSSGQVTLAFSPHLSVLIATKLLGGNMEDHTPEAINDAIGELVNIVTGNLQSKLCDAGLRSDVGLPEVKFQTALPTEPVVPGGSNDHYFFHCGTHTMAVCLSIDPSGKRAPTTQGNSWRANGL
jgi:CheY-specific phosphatase CheX